MTNIQSSAVFSNAVTKTSSSNIIQLPVPHERIFVSEGGSTWYDAVKTRLEELIRLPNGWDGYRGVHVSFENANFAFRMLDAICEIDSVAPQIVPGTVGDLQIEWHTLKGDVELHVKAPNNVHAWHASAEGDPNGTELDLTNNFVDVAQWIREIAGPTVDAESAATRR